MRARNISYPLYALHWILSVLFCQSTHIIFRKIYIKSSEVNKNFLWNILLLVGLIFNLLENMAEYYKDVQGLLGSRCEFNHNKKKTIPLSQNIRTSGNFRTIKKRKVHTPLWTAGSLGPLLSPDLLSLWQAVGLIHATNPNYLNFGAGPVDFPEVLIFWNSI